MNEDANSLKYRITEDMKSAMRAKDGARLSTIRMLTAAIKQREVDERIVLTDAEVIGIVEKQIKQRRDSISQFEAAARVDLADKEKAEVDVLLGYLPSPLSTAEIETAIEAAISDSGAVGAAGIGKVMALLKPRLAGRADMAAVSTVVKQRLAR